MQRPMTARPRAHRVDCMERALAGVRVLLVDDDCDTRDLYTYCLERAGAEVRACSSAAEAIRTAMEWAPSVLVSDLHLPDMDGYALLLRFRAIAGARAIPAIAVTGRAFPRDRTAALDAGFQEHAAKPLAPDDFVAIVRWWALAAARRESRPPSAS